MDRGRRRDRAREDENCAIESAKANAALYAPMAGAIARFNDAAMADPSIINKSGYGEGWLFEMTGDAAGTMDAPAYVAYLEASWAKAQALLKGQMK
jgi:glycine cleavage system H lipoate-binding protein